MKYKKPENYIENKGDVLASKSYHIMFPEGIDSICNAGVKAIDNKQWEIFWINKETEKAYYGTPAEGLGLMDCMILKKDTRDFLPEEIEELEKHVYSLGKMIQKIKIEPIKPKWKERRKNVSITNKKEMV